ncbi:hypothetical protein [Streptomyces youssoufiensis]
MFFFDVVTRVRAGVRIDRGGNQVPDWTVATRLVIGQLNVQPATQVESENPTRTAVVTGWRVQSAPGTAPDVRADDRIEWDGMTLEVQGEVARWPDPITGATHHVEFTVSRATG